MILRHLKIENFRGIHALSWHVSGRIICLVGPNDSTKTTILDAIEIALLPRMTVSITDADFHNLDISKPITIEATIGELSQALIEEEKYGLYLRGYESGKDILEDPTDNSEPVLTVRFSVDAELEPEWFVVKASHDEPKPCGWRDRSKFGLARLGSEIDRHLTWARGSALSRLTTDESGIERAFLEASRQARAIVADADLASLNEATAKARESAKFMGVEFKDLKHGLDAASLSFGNSGLGLHEANIPLRQWGLGTRRLSALAVQQSDTGQQSILLIDEIEHGLEPHRQRHLVKRLSSNWQETGDRSEGQVIFSTHSPTPIIALPVPYLRFVRSHAGQTTVAEVQANSQSSLQSLARTHSHAFLGRKLLICEGATEVGLCRGLEDYWAEEKAGRHPTHVGFVAVNGNGRTNAPDIALEFKRIGYDVAVFADSDEPLQPKAEDLLAQGMDVFLWEGTVCTEQRLVLDLPVAAVQLLLDEAYKENGMESVLGQVGGRCGINNLVIKGAQFVDWLDGSLSEDAARTAIGLAAKKHSWFKNVTLGIQLGEIVAANLPQMLGTSTCTTLAEVRDWIYG